LPAEGRVTIALLKINYYIHYGEHGGQEFGPRNGADWATALQAAYQVCDV